MNEIAEAITDAPEGTAVVLTKTRNRVILEGSIYFLVSGLSPLIALLEKEGDLDARSVTAAALAGIVAGAISIKAFLSHSHHE